MSVFTVVLTIEIGVLTILLNASSVLPFNNSDSVGNVGIGVVVLLLGVEVDSILEVGVTGLVVSGTSALGRIKILLSVVTGICSVLLEARIVLIDGTVKTSSVVEVVKIGLVVVLGIAVVLKVVLVLVGVFNVVEVALTLFNESALASKFWGVVCSSYKI